MSTLPDTPIRFALNHAIAPHLAHAPFFELARATGLGEVEIRNDVAAASSLDRAAGRGVREAAARAGVQILTVNALQRFNDWSPEREAEAATLADFAAECGARSLVLVPVNDGSGRGDDQRVANVEAALRQLKPILAERGLVGLVECLGFELSSLRKKSEAVAAIDAVGGRDTFRLVHDTFHHHLAGEHEIYPEFTEIVHISGVDDLSVPVSDMQDPNRVLVGPDDRVSTVEQLGDLITEGYHGPVSIEPFAPSVTGLEDPRAAIAESIRFIQAELAGKS